MTQHDVGTILQISSAPSQGLRRAVQVRESIGGVGWRWREATDAEMQKMTEALNGDRKAT
jgi:hypothetical protein